ncbi:MAG: PrsW family intramembrane metalloprotease [Candidatus Woykebacteria bacterium]
MIFVLIPILAFLPAFFWFFIFLREDKFDPEPRRLIIKLFLLGTIAALFAAILEFAVASVFFGPFSEDFGRFFNDPNAGSFPNHVLIFLIIEIILFAALEEVLKITVVREFVFYDPHFRQVVDGAIFGISAGLGFATLENLGYFFGTASEEGTGSLVVVFILRFFASTLLHALTSGMSGYYLGKSKFSKEKAVFWQGLIAAVLTHAAFNLFLFGGFLGVLFEVVFLVIILVFLINKMESTEAQTIWGLVFLKGAGKKGTTS